MGCVSTGGHHTPSEITLTGHPRRGRLPASLGPLREALERPPRWSCECDGTRGPTERSVWSLSHSELTFSVQRDWWGHDPPGQGWAPWAPGRCWVMDTGTAPSAAWEGPGHVGSHSLPPEGRPVYPFLSGPECQSPALDLVGSLALGFWDLVSLCFHCLVCVWGSLAPHGF